jgi:hypothetical protein
MYNIARRDFLSQEEQHISVGEFRLSQLGGSRRRGGVKKDLSESCESKWASWRLTHEERRRLKVRIHDLAEHPCY